MENITIVVRRASDATILTTCITPKMYLTIYPLWTVCIIKPCNIRYQKTCLKCSLKRVLTLYFMAIKNPNIKIINFIIVYTVAMKHMRLHQVKEIGKYSKEKSIDLDSG